MTDYNMLKSPRITLPKSCQHLMFEHCRRKLTGDYLTGEEKNRMAFGLIAGIRSEVQISIRSCLPLLKNARAIEPHRQFMNKMMADHAIPSETPFEKRGWVADPEELSGAVTSFSRDGLTLLGSYHMHRIAWENDPVRDTPTTLDTILGRGSRLIMFIISMVNPDTPVIRAFREGNNAEEIQIDIIENE